MGNTAIQTNDLPKEIDDSLRKFVDTASQVIGSNLVSVVLFGSAAEGRLRLTSDVNLLLILRAFEREQMDGIREPYRLARASIDLNCMFVLEEELADASEAFSVKFQDILNRHRVLFGKDVLKTLKISREATVRRLKQVLLNMSLRMREHYVLSSLREEQLTKVVADNSGPLRASAATLLALEGVGFIRPKEALEKVVNELNQKNLFSSLSKISQARETGHLDKGAASETFLSMMTIVQALYLRVEKVKL
jgi:predicted nucleotidyltransferase